MEGEAPAEPRNTQAPSRDEAPRSNDSRPAAQPLHQSPITNQLNPRHLLAVASLATLRVMRAPSLFRSDERYNQRQFRTWLEGQAIPPSGNCELLNGHIVREPPAAWPHAPSEAAIVTALTEHVRDHRLGIVLGSSMGYDLPSGDTVEPDASFLSHDRLKAGPPPITGEFLRLPPTLAVEIVSPSTGRRDRGVKRDILPPQRGRRVLDRGSTSAPGNGLRLGRTKLR